MLKIAQIVCAYPPYAGGIGNSAALFHELLKDSYQIDNFTPQNTKALAKKGHGAILAQLLWKLNKYDYIYLHYPFFGTSEIVWLFKLLKPKKKLIIYYHMDVKNFSSSKKILSLPSLLIRKSLLKKADKIAVSSFDYIENSEIKNFFLKNKYKFREIPFAVDTEKFCPKEINLPSGNKSVAKAKSLIKTINKLFIKKDRLDIIFTGALDKAHYFKGVPVLLSALASWDKQSWKLKIVGEGDLKQEYINMASDLGIDKKITFTGKLSESDLIRALQESDTLILPSINRNEAFGIVLLEALACGLPVIASNLPGVRSVFRNNQEGLLVEPENAKDLREKINLIYENESLRKNMSQAARELALSKYSLKKLRQNYENLFN